ncbi:MAG TPA: adenylate/guanylate cyclase domain-containing protein [Burkholderiales bacterium]|nr:adenylate/guanylate cyclase domain-containing protein [Burkholderiales bacterium]
MGTFHLRRYFSIASGAAVLTVTIAMGWLYYREEVADHIEATQAANVMLAQTFANTTWPQYGGYLSRLGPDASAIRSDPNIEDLDRTLAWMARQVPVVKIKIYNTSGMAIYSSVRAEIGEDKSANPGFRAALAGRAMSELTHRGSMSATEGRIENVDVVSTYIPIRADGGRIAAVFELYANVTEAVARIEGDTLRVVGGVALVLAALYGVLLLIVGRADRLLQRQHRELEGERLGRLKRFFSPQVAELIAAGGMDDPLKTHRREITAVSIDLRGFTAFTESAEPEEVISMLREYHDEIGRLILKHEGTIEYFAGDGIMVIFNDPVPVPDAAARAVRMALEMQEAYDRFGARWKARGFELGLGIGVAQGYATIGAIGFEGRRDYAAIGSVTNLSARLCGEAKSGEILICRKVKAALNGGVRTEAEEEFRLKGFAQPVPAYAVKRAAPVVVELTRPGLSLVSS